jgi:hypothetical protein
MRRLAIALLTGQTAILVLDEKTSNEERQAHFTSSSPLLVPIPGEKRIRTRTQILTPKQKRAILGSHFGRQPFPFCPPWNWTPLIYGVPLQLIASIRSMWTYFKPVRLKPFS